MGAIYGRDDQEYKKFFRILVNCSDEKQVLAREVLNFLQPKPSYRFLDIGAGSGEITRAVSANVKETVAIEPNPQFIESLQNQGFHVIPKRLEETTIEGNFDIILLSHSFYYVANYFAFAKDLLNHLNKNGRICFVVFTGKGDWHDMHDEFFAGKNFVTITANNFVQDLTNLGLRVVRKDVETHYQLPENEMASLLTYFFSISDPLQKEKLMRLVHDKTTHGITRLNAYHTLIMVQK